VFERDGGILGVSLVPWDTEIFGFPVGQVTRFDIGATGRPAALLSELDEWCTAHDVRLVSCRLGNTQLRESMALEGLGFRFVEMVYGPHLDRLDRIAEPRHRIELTEASRADLGAIEEIAYDAFTTGRYLLDWRLPPDLSRQRYATWVRNSVDAPGQVVLKAESDGNLVGFFVIEHRPDASVYWHLTAIAPRWQGQGYGGSVWRSILRRHGAEGAASVETTISAHNAPIINLYGRLGFTFDAPRMTFHWLRDAG
jgi:RimJ/RimL family protein N-acetyltransferase